MSDSMLPLTLRKQAQGFSEGNLWATFAIWRPRENVHACIVANTVIMQA